MFFGQKHSINSEWVHTEAAEGKERNILVPVRIEDVEIPLAFKRRQTANLVNWDKKQTDPLFKRLVYDIGLIILDGAVNPHPDPPPPKNPLLKKILIIGSVIILLALGSYFAYKFFYLDTISNVELTVFEPVISDKNVSINGVIN